MRSRRLGIVALGLLASASALVGCSDGGGASTSAAGAPSSSASGQAAATPEPTPTFTPRTFSLVATGDLLLHERLWSQAEQDAASAGSSGMDFAPMLAAIQPYTSAADLALCHLETPLAPPGGPFKGYPLFSAPPQILPALVSLGYDACSTASNHTFDQGAVGSQRTLDALDAAGIAHAGSARTPEEAAQTRILDVNGVKVALLSFTYGFNGIPYPNGETWRANLIDAGAITTAAASARQRGAQVVVLALHWGTEYQQTPDALQLELAPQLAQDPNIDIVIGHHAHVVEPIEKIGRTWVVYGMGNLVAAQRRPAEPRSEGLLVRFGFTEQPDGRFGVTTAEYLPLYDTDAYPIRVLDVPKSLATGAYGTTDRPRLELALSRTTSVVESRGGAAAGLLRIG